MNGTEKQIAWAEEIKAGTMIMLDRIIAEAQQRADRAVEQGKITRDAADAQLATLLGQVDTMRAKAITKDSASWWIDNRTRLGNLVSSKAEDADRLCVSISVLKAL
jgi:hypothetical protein